MSHIARADAVVVGNVVQKPNYGDFIVCCIVRNPHYGWIGFANSAKQFYGWFTPEQLIVNS